MTAGQAPVGAELVSAGWRGLGDGDLARLGPTRVQKPANERLSHLPAPDDQQISFFGHSPNHRGTGRTGHGPQPARPGTSHFPERNNG